jgi:hypothetical protein
MRAASVMILVAAGCGGGDFDDKRISELTDSELEDLCTDIIAVSTPSREITCPDGDTEEVGDDGETVAQCVAETRVDVEQFPDCQLTAGELRTCVEAIYSDEFVCDDSASGFPRECAPLFEESCSDFD